MIKYIKYLLVFLLATGFVACSEDEGAQILGGLYEKVDITPEPGMNLVGRVTDGTGPIEGVVVSDKMDKTITVAVEQRVKHALYGKYLRRSTKLHAHDADNACNEGDVVRVTEIAPMSKTKNWRVVEVITRAAE